MQPQLLTIKSIVMDSCIKYIGKVFEMCFLPGFLINVCRAVGGIYIKVCNEIYENKNNNYVLITF